MKEGLLWMMVLRLERAIRKYWSGDAVTLVLLQFLNDSSRRVGK
jgi:hypothetical protein